MKPVENLFAAVWKSAVTEVVQRHYDTTDHPLVDAAERYIEALEQGRPLRDTDPDIEPYLAQLHHQKAHAKLNGDTELEKQLDAQLARFKFGNPLWQQMFIQYFAYYAQYPYHQGGTPQYRSWQDAGKGDLNYGVIEWRLPSNARIAVVGDIGTGTDVAAAVLVSALSFKPDAILHVGDIYYSGTQFEFEHRFIGLFESVFRSAGHRAPVFTVPGNHEYFTGAIAFLDCLDSGRLRLRDDQRQQASYFALRSEDDGWQFLGMDTGYHGHTMSVPPDDQKKALAIIHAKDPNAPLDPTVTLPTDVAVVVLRDDEAQWHRDKLARFPGRSILLSHHQLYSAKQSCGTPQNANDPNDFNRAWINAELWKQLGSFFGSNVAAWIWGHEHNLEIFQSNYRPADWPQNDDATNVFKTLPKGRCAGHSAIPVQDTETPYAQTYPVPLEQPSLQLGLVDGWYNRGFEILELVGAGQPLRARYFQVAGADPTPLLIYEEEIV